MTRIDDTRGENLKACLGPAFSHYLEDLDALEKLKRAGFDAPTIYDIGASNTIWSVMAHAVFPTSHLEMFEPLAELSERYAKGKLTHPKVVAFLAEADQRTHPIVLGSKNGKCRFHRLADESASTSIGGTSATSDSVVYDLPVHRLDDYVHSQGLRPPDIIKLDTQGSEMDILTGATQALNSARAVHVECWLTKAYGEHTPLLPDMTEFLNRHGFFPADLCGEHRNKQNVLHTKDVLFVKEGAVSIPAAGEITTGENALSVLAGKGFTPNRIHLAVQDHIGWKTEAGRICPGVEVLTLPIAPSRGTKAGDNNLSEVLVVDDSVPDTVWRELIKHLLHPGMAVVVQTPLRAGTGAANRSFLEVVRQLASRDFHVLDFGQSHRDTISGFVVQVDTIFINRTHDISPLRRVRKSGLYSKLKTLRRWNWLWPRRFGLR